tara:strand:+ start:241 stop:783 length:543 start_codon:yes stop_codon:yes gene_type:complete
MAEVGIGKIVGSAQILPDDIATVITGISYSYTPVADEKWYYKLTDVAIAAPVDLIAGNFLQDYGDAGARTSTAAPAAITTSDIVKFLFIKNMAVEADGTTGIAASVYLSLNGSTTGDLAEIAAADNDIIEIGQNETLALKLNCTVADLHCEAGTPLFATQALTTSKLVQCMVAAVIKDVA